MEKKYKLNVRGEEAKRVRDEIRMDKLKRKMRKSIEPSVKWQRAYFERNFGGEDLINGSPYIKRRDE